MGWSNWFWTTSIELGRLERKALSPCAGTVPLSGRRQHGVGFGLRAALRFVNINSDVLKSSALAQSNINALAGQLYKNVDFGLAAPSPSSPSRSPRNSPRGSRRLAPRSKGYGSPSTRRTFARSRASAGRRSNRW